VPAFSLRLLLVGVLLLLLAFSGWAQSSLPEATSYVNDFAGVLESTARTELDGRLKTLAENTDYELAVAIFDEMPADYEDSKELATALFNEWGVGKADGDTGVLILLCVGARRVEIETGYGVEGILPDVRCGQLLQEYAVPAFKKEDWAGGLTALAGAVIEVLEKGEAYEEDEAYAAEESEEPELTPLWLTWLYRLLFFGGFVLVILFFRWALTVNCEQCKKRTKQAPKAEQTRLPRYVKYICPACGHVQWQYLPPSSSSSGSSSRSSWSGSSSSGSSSSSSFGGFGGGSSGGGGAGASF
jgi:uncharacterized protein